MMEIINFVKDFRVRNGYTQEELAGLAGVSRQSINSIERGKYVPSLPLALKFASIFQCSMDALFLLKEESHG